MEYYLLNAKFINDKDLNDYLKVNILKFQSKEQLYTRRLIDLTKDTSYSYSKSEKTLKECYYKNCSIAKYCKYLECDKFNIFKAKDELNLSNINSGNIPETNYFI